MNRILRNVLLVLFGRIGLTALWLGAYVLTFRILGNVEAGKFAFCLVMIRLVSDCLGDPLDLAVVRRTPSLLATDRQKALDVWRGALIIRCIAGLAVAGIFAIASKLMAAVFFHDARDFDLIVVTGVGALSMLAFRAIVVFFQAMEDFPRLVTVEAIMQLSRVAAILALAVTDQLTSRSALNAYVGVTIIACVAGTLCLPKGLMRHLSGGLAELAGVLKYSAWMVLAMTLAAVYCHVDEFLVATFRGPGEVGFYSAAMALALIPEFATGAISSVLNPKVVRLYESGEFRAFQSQYLMVSIPLGILAIVLMLVLSPWAITMIYADEYAPAIPAVRLLATGTLLWLMLSPLAAGLITLVDPRKTMMLNAMMLLPTAAVGLLIIPKYGFIGAAVLFLMTRITSIAALYMLAVNIIHKQNLRLHQVAKEAHRTTIEADTRLPSFVSSSKP